MECKFSNVAGLQASKSKLAELRSLASSTVVVKCGCVCSQISQNANSLSDAITTGTSQSSTGTKDRTSAARQPKYQLFRLPHVISRACEVHHARRQRALAAEELARSQANLAQLTEHLQESIEAERAAIAREIHDDIGGALTAIRFDLAWLERHATDAAMTRHAQAATEMLQHALGASQRIMKSLRPPVLDQGLAAALEWLAQDFERRTSIPVQLACCLGTGPLPRQLELVAYRTAQEALTNISKHAAASHARIELSDAEGVLTLEVSDDGCGMAADARNKRQSFGLIGLAERAKTAGGWLDVSSRPGLGTSIILSVPLHSDAHP